MSKDTQIFQQLAIASTCRKILMTIEEEPFGEVVKYIEELALMAESEYKQLTETSA